MKRFNEREQNAIEAVARRFSASWEEGSDPPDAFVVAAGRRIAVDIATLKECGPEPHSAMKPRLRFDRVATRLLQRLQATVGETAPDGTTVLLTVTAPILLPSKTAAALEERIQALLGNRSSGQDNKETIHGNRTQIRILRKQSERAPKMIGLCTIPIQTRFCF